MLCRLSPIDPNKAWDGFEAALVVGHQRITARHGMAGDQAVQNHVVASESGFLQCIKRLRGAWRGIRGQG